MSDDCGDGWTSACVGSEGIGNGEGDDGENGDDFFVALLGGSSVVAVLDGSSVPVVLGLGFLEKAPFKQFMLFFLEKMESKECRVCERKEK